MSARRATMRRSKSGSGLFLFGNGPRDGSCAALETACRLIGGRGRGPHSELCERVVKQSDKFLEGRVGHRNPHDLDIFDRAFAELSRRRSKGKQDDSRPFANMGAGDEDRRIYGHWGTKYVDFYREALTVFPPACSAANPASLPSAKGLLCRGFPRNNSDAHTLSLLAMAARTPGSMMDSRRVFPFAQPRRRRAGKERERSIPERVSSR